MEWGRKRKKHGQDRGRQSAGQEECDGDKKNGVEWRDKRNREGGVEGRKGRGEGVGMGREHEEWSTACRF